MNYPPTLDNKMHVIIFRFNKFWLIQFKKNIDNSSNLIMIWCSESSFYLGFIHHPDLHTNQNISEKFSVYIFMWRSVKKFLLV